MSKQVRQPLISEAYIEAAKKRIREVGREELERELRTREPHLNDMLRRYCNEAAGGGPEDLSDETRAIFYGAVFSAALVALEAYRIAQYHLWADTCLGPQMERLDPSISSGRFTAADRRRLEAEAEDDEDPGFDGQGDDDAEN